MYSYSYEGHESVWCATQRVSYEPQGIESTVNFFCVFSFVEAGTLATLLLCYVVEVSKLVQFWKGLERHRNAEGYRRSFIAECFVF